MALITAVGLVIGLLIPGTGTVAVTVKDQDGHDVTEAEVYVYPEGLMCKSTPCRIEKLATGPREFYVQPGGECASKAYETCFDPVKQNIMISRYSQSVLNFVITHTLGGSKFRVVGPQPTVLPSTAAASTGGRGNGGSTVAPSRKNDCGCNGDLMCLMKCSTH
jgi:hypothetical protein